jgi:hypothetical protein
LSGADLPQQRRIQFMKAEISLVKLALCGPGDVKKETEIAQEVVTDWNVQHGETNGFWISESVW